MFRCLLEKPHKKIEPNKNKNRLALILVWVTIAMLATLFASNLYVYADSKNFAFNRMSMYKDESKILHLFGEITNLSKLPMSDIIVHATFYDSGSTLLNEFKRASELTVLNPGQTSPFEILYIDSDSVDRVKDYKLSALAKPSDLKTPAIRIINNNSRLDITGFYYLYGKIANEGKQTATNTSVIATMYDKNGNVVALGHAQSEPLDIAPGSQAAFGTAITERLQTNKIKSFSLAAESDQFVTLPEVSQVLLLFSGCFLVLILVERVFQAKLSTIGLSP